MPGSSEHHIQEKNSPELWPWGRGDERRGEVTTRGGPHLNIHITNLA